MSGGALAQGVVVSGFGAKGCANTVNLSGSDRHFEGAVATGEGTQGEEGAVLTSGAKGKNANFVIVWGFFRRETGGVVWRSCWGLSEGGEAERWTRGGVRTWGRIV